MAGRVKRVRTLHCTNTQHNLPRNCNGRGNIAARGLPEWTTLKDSVTSGYARIRALGPLGLNLEIGMERARRA